MYCTAQIQSKMKTDQLKLLQHFQRLEVQCKSMASMASRACSPFFAVLTRKDNSTELKTFRALRSGFLVWQTNYCLHYRNHL